MDGSPTRSPMNVADYLIDVTRGKTLTEVGSRNGDIIACVTHQKKNVERIAPPVSVELDREYCEKMRRRGIHVTCESITDLDETTMPISDYYFWWPMAAATQNVEWLRHVSGVLRKRGVARGKTAIIACDMSWREDVDNAYELRDHFGGQWIGKVWYDEGDDDRMFGAFRLIHVPLDFDFPSEEEVEERKRRDEMRREEERRRREREQEQEQEPQRSRRRGRRALAD